MRELKLPESAHPRGPRRTDSVPRALWAEGGRGWRGWGRGEGGGTAGALRTRRPWSGALVTWRAGLCDLAPTQHLSR